MAKQANTIYQLKITLADIRPPIWRRVEVKDCTLARLHQIIQQAMGWEDYHLWSFTAGGEEYGPAEMVDDPFGMADIEDASSIELSQIAEAGIRRFGYLYDFGDSLTHRIQLEKTNPAEPGVRYPRCIKGKRACPPEDCGGPWGYGALLEAIDDPNHEDHEQMVQWLGGKFDPEAFDLETVNARLARLR